MFSVTLLLLMTGEITEVTGPVAGSSVVGFNTLTGDGTWIPLDEGIKSVTRIRA